MEPADTQLVSGSLNQEQDKDSVSDSTSLYFDPEGVYETDHSVSVISEQKDQEDLDSERLDPSGDGKRSTRSRKMEVQRLRGSVLGDDIRTRSGLKKKIINLNMNEHIALIMAECLENFFYISLFFVKSFFYTNYQKLLLLSAVVLARLFGYLFCY